jgi:hypothetical protein
MTDLAKLGIEVDTRQVKQAATDLEKLAEAGRTTAATTEKVTLSSDKYIESLQRQVLMYGKTASEQRRIEISLQNLTDAERAHAYAIVNSMEAQSKSDANARESARLLQEREEQYRRYGLAIAAAATAAATATAYMVKSAIDAADAVNTLSIKTGLSATAITGYQHAAALSNVSNEAMASGFKMLAKTLAGGGEELESFGVKIRDANGKMLDADTIFKNVADRVAGASTALEAAAISEAAFSRAGDELLPVLKEGSVGLEKFRIEAEMLGTAISDDFAKDAAKFNDNLDQMGLMAKAAANSIAGFLLPALNAVSDLLITTSEERAKAFKIELANLTEEGVIRTEWQRERIAFLNEEIAKLDQVGKLEQARGALAGAAKLGDIRDARDRFGEVATGKAPKETKAPKEAAEETRDLSVFKDLGAAALAAAEWEAFLIKSAEDEAALSDTIEQGRIAGEEAALNNRMTAGQKLLDYLTEHNMNKGEIEATLHEENMQKLMAANLSTEEEEVRHVNAKIKIWEDERRAKQTADNLIQQNYMTAGENIYRLLESGGKKNAALAKVLFAAMKAVQVAEVITATSTAAAMTEAGLIANAATTASTMGPYAGPVYMGVMAGEAALAAAAVMASGYAKAASIAAVSIGQMSGGGGSGGSISIGGGGGAPSSAGGAMPIESARPAAALTGQSNVIEAEAMRDVSITIYGDAFDYNSVANKLIPAINEAVGNGVNLAVSRG